MYRWPVGVVQTKVPGAGERTDHPGAPLVAWSARQAATVRGENRPSSDQVDEDVGTTGTCGAGVVRSPGGLGLDLAAVGGVTVDGDRGGADDSPGLGDRRHPWTVERGVPRDLAVVRLTDRGLRLPARGGHRFAVVRPRPPRVESSLTQVGEHSHLLGLDEPLEPLETCEHLDQLPVVDLGNRRCRAQRATQLPLERFNRK